MFFDRPELKRRFLFFAVTFLFAGTSLFSLSAQETAGVDGLLTLRGVSHVHSQYSHDSNASLRDIIEELEAETLDFALITDHNSLTGIDRYSRPKSDTQPFLLFANEISGPDGHVIALGVYEMPPEDISSQEIVDWIHEKGGYAILAHPVSPKEPWSAPEVTNWEGFEVYNFAHELYDNNIIGFGLNLYGQDEADDSMLETTQELNAESSQMWDDRLETHRTAAFGGSNAHLKKSKKYFRLAVKSSVMYVRVPDRSDASVIKALGEGRSYIVFETRGRADDFLFQAETGGKTFGIGDSVPMGPDAVIHVKMPGATRIQLIHHGKVVKEIDGEELTFPVQDPGAYRVEVYKDADLWIFSNAIYLENAAAA